MGGRSEPRWTAALFDLDGTLIDTRPGMLTALGAALSEVMGDDTGARLANLSLPLEAMVGSAAPAATAEERQLMTSAFRRHYDAGHWKAAQVYPGAETCLSEFRAAGLRTFVVTNKRTRAAERLLEQFHLAGYFERVLGQPEAGTPTPKSDLAGQCLADAGLNPGMAVVVGDSDHDAAMAASWGMTFLALTSGAGPLSPASADHHRIDVDSLAGASALVLDEAPGRDS
ncbi:MAG TPA: HAD family hydrolase [Patescibacteria group bacterium]|nr:HAD family hydrolase [Patescibacteria group bacterium]